MRNGNQQQRKCRLSDWAPETASWSSRPCSHAATHIHRNGSTPKRQSGLRLTGGLAAQCEEAAAVDAPVPELPPRNCPAKNPLPPPPTTPSIPHPSPPG